MMVQPEYQRHGIATALFHMARQKVCFMFGMEMILCLSIYQAKETGATMALSTGNEQNASIRSLRAGFLS